jgi:hypothetical protein
VMRPDDDGGDSPSYARLHRGGKAGTGNYLALSSVLQSSCTYMEHRNATKAMLVDAKVLLEKHFEVMILELFDDKLSPSVLQATLGGVDSDKSFYSKFELNAGILSKTAAPPFRSVPITPKNILAVDEFALTHMPAEVLSRIKEENVFDIELFEFAVRLYQSRVNNVTT